MSWGQKKIQGQVYDLTHLDPFIFPVTPKADGARTFNVHVSFGLHVFTEEWDDSYTPDLKFTDGDELRCFSIDRHSHSLELPQIIQDAASGRAYFSDYPHTFTVSKNLPNLVGPYSVYFKIEKAKSPKFDASMFVVSAYEKQNLPPRLKKITFATLVSHTVMGKPIRRPR